MSGARDVSHCSSTEAHLLYLDTFLDSWAPWPIGKCRIPYLPLLKTQCAGQIQSYSGCLASASAEGIPDSAVQERCGASLKDLWQCCERVMASAEAKAPQQQRT